MVPFRTIAPVLCSSVKAALTLGRLAPISRPTSPCDMPSASGISIPWAARYLGKQRARRAQITKAWKWERGREIDYACNPSLEVRTPRTRPLDRGVCEASLALVPGGGVALLRAAKALDELQTENDDQRIGINIVRKALSWPARLIAINAGEDGSVVVGKSSIGRPMASATTRSRGITVISRAKASLTQPRWCAMPCKVRHQSRVS